MRDVCHFMGGAKAPMPKRGCGISSQVSFLKYAPFELSFDLSFDLVLLLLNVVVICRMAWGESVCD